MERINLSFFGQQIDGSEVARIKSQISYHMGDAPSDASICCCISKEPEGLACNLQVHSAKGHLFIHRESRSLDTLLEFVYSSMKRSFADWRQNPSHFAKKHPLDKNPCRSASHKTIPCPIQSFSNQATSGDNR